MNILITSAGRRVSLINAFKMVSKQLNTSSKIFFTVLVLVRSPASYFADDSFKIGFFNDPSYINDLLEICLKNKCAMVITSGKNKKPIRGIGKRTKATWFIKK